MWVGAFWRPYPALRLGGGPAWYRLVSQLEKLEISRVGLMGEAGGEVPMYGRFFLDLAVRFHLIPTQDVEHDLFGPLTLRPNWSHTALLVGVGFHI